MADVDDLKAQVDAAHEEATAAMQKHADLLDEYLSARTASFQPKIVDEARRIGINPDNFEDENSLQEAINRQLKENPELHPDNNFTKAEPEE